MKRYIRLLSALLIALVFLTACQNSQKSTPKEAQSQVQKGEHRCDMEYMG